MVLALASSSSILNSAMTISFSLFFSIIFYLLTTTFLYSEQQSESNQLRILTGYFLLTVLDSLDFSDGLLHLALYLCNTLHCFYDLIAPALNFLIINNLNFKGLEIMGDKRIRIEKSNIDEGKWQKPATVHSNFFLFRYAPEGNRICATKG